MNTSKIQLKCRISTQKRNSLSGLKKQIINQQTGEIQGKGDGKTTKQYQKKNKIIKNLKIDLNKLKPAVYNYNQHSKNLESASYSLNSPNTVQQIINNRYNDQQEFSPVANDSCQLMNYPRSNNKINGSYQINPMNYITQNRSTKIYNQNQQLKKEQKNSEQKFKIYKYNSEQQSSQLKQLPNFLSKNQDAEQMDRSQSVIKKRNYRIEPQFIYKSNKNKYPTYNYNLNSSRSKLEKIFNQNQSQNTNLQLDFSNIEANKNSLCNNNDANQKENSISNSIIQEFRIHSNNQTSQYDQINYLKNQVEQSQKKNEQLLKNQILNNSIEQQHQIFDNNDISTIEDLNKVNSHRNYIRKSSGKQDKFNSCQNINQIIYNKSLQDSKHIKNVYSSTTLLPQIKQSYFGNKRNSEQIQNRFSSPTKENLHIQQQQQKQYKLGDSVINKNYYTNIQDKSSIMQQQNQSKSNLYGSKQIAQEQKKVLPLPNYIQKLEKNQKIKEELDSELQTVYKYFNIDINKNYQSLNFYHSILKQDIEKLTGKDNLILKAKMEQEDQDELQEILKQQKRQQLLEKYKSMQNPDNIEIKLQAKSGNNYNLFKYNGNTDIPKGNKALDKKRKQAIQLGLVFPRQHPVINVDDINFFNWGNIHVNEVQSFSHLKKIPQEKFKPLIDNLKKDIDEMVKQIYEFAGQRKLRSKYDQLLAIVDFFGLVSDCVLNKKKQFINDSINKDQVLYNVLGSNNLEFKRNKPEVVVEKISKEIRFINQQIEELNMQKQQGEIYDMGDKLVSMQNQCDSKEKEVDIDLREKQKYKSNDQYLYNIYMPFPQVEDLELKFGKFDRVDKRSKKQHEYIDQVMFNLRKNDKVLKEKI
ncbi:hypothetical protein PPERSA_06786 [Pseudocohnilembus persalinus]|uniref:Uncharacterized protein n=1 Tax=Pseudocohnilembus persalinus TaxID=266149 RepID=A0A0V0QT38_PSEPJ|nr:hypothetical protein PPERSA_06786 [Pseudocohnilembus persalinus]|eukprot:KRX05152.1 hypothetical protein PPERSA_06786 [Pseudocohnilembus persalinus]